MQSLVKYKLFRKNIEVNHRQVERFRPSSAGEWWNKKNKSGLPEPKLKVKARSSLLSVALTKHSQAQCLHAIGDGELRAGRWSNHKRDPSKKSDSSRQSFQSSTSIAQWGQIFN